MRRDSIAARARAETGARALLGKIVQSLAWLDDGRA
jgi:hypothetical protein